MSKNDGASILLEIFKTVIIIAVIVVSIRNFVVQPFYVVGSSMEPSFQSNDYLIIDEFTYHIRQPRRGEVIVLKHPEPECDAFLKQNFFAKLFAKEPCRNYIKRIIGVPGDAVKVEGGNVYVKSKGTGDFIMLNENYIDSQLKGQTLGNQVRELQDDEFYVIGDNREPGGSSDSREWGILKRDHIVGKTWLRLLPKYSRITTPEYNTGN
ncbi:MAG: Signal peptidase I [candidate division CPR2 bacterium GW2011_GWC1_39_9]|uniref:Signal peptidase I n=1 Tax=candidate division CPR2 bacterium GW2011_GWC2_39_10 TaxID=1618345 RepID=A0A0G0Q0T1_UNCC2|nr:MAG: Signal peptidase I [candidate division CPR2 bacterium GW2011_GWC2_39_10]KKR34347.1 MAG: Signal peptidase I [candidate division CPR2 bacterium GW2011_GWC1_39_9]